MYLSKLPTDRWQTVVLILLMISSIWLISIQRQAIADASPDPRGLVIVMNKDIDISSIDDEELRRLFTGKSLRLPNGARAALASYAPESSFFNETMLGLSDAKVSSLWSRLRFSGRTPPPRFFDTVEELVEYVSSTSNALAYMPASASRVGIRVITNLPR